MIELRDLIKTAKSEPTTANIEAMWKAVYLLGAWYFAPGKRTPGATTPMVAQEEDGAWLLAFTNFRQLSRFEREHDLLLPDGNLNMLVLDPLKSTRLVQEHASHIVGVVFNPQSDETFRAPVDALVAYARHFGLDV